MAPLPSQPDSASEPLAGAVEPRPPRGRPETLAWLGGTALFAGIAVSAALGLAYRLSIVGGRLDERQTLAGMVAVSLYLLVAVCWLIGIGFVVRRLGAGWALGVGLMGTAAVRVAASLAIDVPLSGEWLAYHEQAMAIATGGPQLGDQPIGYPLVLGGLYAAFGPQVWLAEALNVVMSLISSAIVFDLLRRSAGPVAGAVGIGLVAIIPSLALMTPVVSPDLTYAALLLAVIWSLAVLTTKPPGVRGRSVPPAGWATATAGLAGGLLGASQYVRPSSGVLLPAFVVVAMVALPDVRPRRGALVLVLAFFAVLAPVIADSAVRQGQLSVQTGSLGDWQLDAGGGPGGAPALALRKVVSTWGDDGYAVAIALAHRDPPVAAGLLVAGYLASALAWALVMAFAASGVLRAGPVLPAWLLAAVLVAVTLTVLQAVVESRPLDHASLTPLLLGAAALAVARRRRAPALRAVEEAPRPAPG